MLWGQEVGSLYWDERRKRAVFNYHHDFIKAGLDIAPLSASVKDPRNRLPIYGLANDDVFHGLPAFIADSLPGRWGNAVFDAWAAENNVFSSEITSVDNPNAIIKRCVEAVTEFRVVASKYGVSEHWQDVVERHFAEMTPDLLSGLHGYKPHVFSFVLEGGTAVEDAQWQEMGNGAFRLTARMNGVEYRATISP